MISNNEMTSRNIAELVMEDEDYAYSLQTYLNAKISTKKQVGKNYDSYLKRYNLTSSFLFLKERIKELDENTLFDESNFVLSISKYEESEINKILIKLYELVLTNELSNEGKIINCFKIRAIENYKKLFDLLD